VLHGETLPLKFGHRQANLTENTPLGAIRAAELLGASVILVALFKPNCPEVDEESSAEPVASLFRKLAPKAAEAGVDAGPRDFVESRG
jgi:hypothetical protein